MFPVEKTAKEQQGGQGGGVRAGDVRGEVGEVMGAVAPVRSLVRG